MKENKINDLEKYFNTMAKREMKKWSNYFDIYELHFSCFRGIPVNVLEIGIGGGGSLQMWKWYFGKSAKIYGFDIERKTLFKEARISTLKVDSGNKSKLLHAMKGLPVMDIVIDDGGHQMEQQITAFETLYPLISENGVYLCEDTHSSFFSEFGGGVLTKRTFFNYMKKKLDQLMAFHSRGSVGMTDFTKTTLSVTFYNSIVVIEKKPISNPIKLTSKRS